MTTTTASGSTDFASLAATADVHLPITLTALAPISHGAGTSGNTQLLRTRNVIDPDGRRASVPYVSGNSIRHTLRAALAWHLTRTLDLPDRSLSKRAVDLLWSGGALTTTGNQADLDLNRRVHHLMPGLGMLGYSARSDITAGTLWAQDAELVCAENAHRLPPHLATHPHRHMPNGALRTDEFGTRHDVLSTPADRFIQLAGDGLLEAPDMTSVQMIHDAQLIKAGAVLSTGLHLACPTPGHRAALAAALDEAAPERDGQRILHLGGRRSTGHGACRLDTDLAPLGDIPRLRADYEHHLTAHRDQILGLITEVTG